MDIQETHVFQVNTEVTPVYLRDLLGFIYQRYIIPLFHNFANVRRWNEEGKDVLAFTFSDPSGPWLVDVQITMDRPIAIRMISNSLNMPSEIINRLKEDLIITIQMFEEKVRKTTLYFAWVPNKHAIPEKVSSRRRKIISQIFLGNMILFFVIFIAFSYAVFLVAREYTPIILVLVQFVIVLFADKIIMRMGDWPITAESPFVHILQYHIPDKDFEQNRTKYKRESLLEIKRRIYEQTLGRGLPINHDIARQVFSEYGIDLKPDYFTTRVINVYDTVKRVVGQMGMPIPKIRISNVIIPNAAATGPAPRFGLVLITTGLLVQLDDDEILSVIGHEISHLKSRDPLVLFGLISAEYLFRVYILWQYLFIFGFFYFIFALGIIFFIAKFFEARADLESAMNIGNPDSLATALTKIGYRRIQAERMTSTRIVRWIGFDPHPPISFRVERLENLKEPWKIRHPFIRSVKDCIRGFLKEF